MSEIIIKNKSLQIIRDLLDKISLEGKVAVDATAGKGQDTLLLAQKVGAKGKVYAFDIQQEALQHTKNLLESNGIENVILIKDSHENINLHTVDKIDFAIFNLGYLPGGDKEIVTNGKSVKIAFNHICHRLNCGGVVAITAYTGHLGSELEKVIVEDFISKLPQKKYSVQKIEFLNQINNPPIVYLIEKYGE